MLAQGTIVAGARILRRAWQVYTAHIFLFVIYMAEIAYLSASFENPLYAEEMNVFDFLRQPDVTLVQALLLKFKPVNMDVLPLYVVLLVGFPPMLWLLLRSPAVALATSAALYALAWEFAWNLPAYPTGHWTFNPFAWQILFVFGAWCGLGGAERLGPVLRHKAVIAVAVAYLLFALFIVLTWYLPRLTAYVPTRLAEFMYPINKTDLDVLRFAHFLALAVVAVRLVPRDWPVLESPWLRPVILCGQHSLEIFCLGVFLAFAAHFLMVEVSRAVLVQVAVSLAGIALMAGVAMLMTWYKGIEGGRARRTVQAGGAGAAE
jgi:hypothetical protein